MEPWLVTEYLTLVISWEKLTDYLLENELDYL